MPRAGLYARFSSDQQDARSIGDQIAILCEYAQRKGYSIAKVYEDAAASGASIHGRPGIQRLLADASTGLFSVVLTESMSRIGRDQEDRAGIRKRLKFYDISIETPAEGVVSPLVDGVRAIIDSEYLEDLKRHTRRGMRGRITEGRSAGGLTYGYRPGADKGSRIIVEEQATIVRRIFEEYHAGRSPRDIAERLNRAGVKPPRGKDWLASSLIGNVQRGSGVLGNVLYDGKLVWNRVTMRKDPRTGLRVSRVNPESEWIVKDVPDLRIVEAELFAQVQAQRERRRKLRPEQSRRPRHLLSGLVRCGCCGFAMSVTGPRNGQRRLGCSRRKEGGVCPNAKTYVLDVIEHRVVEGLRIQLADPRAIERYIATYQAERKRLARNEAGLRANAERENNRAKREIDRVVEAIAQGIVAPAEAKERLARARSQVAVYEKEIADLGPEEKIVRLHPATVERCLATIEGLSKVLAHRTVEGHEDVAKALRELIAAVVIHPPTENELARIEVSGRLAILLGTPVPPHGDLPPALVAGDRTIRLRKPEYAVFRFAA